MSSFIKLTRVVAKTEPSPFTPAVCDLFTLLIFSALLRTRQTEYWFGDPNPDEGRENCVCAAAAVIDWL